LDITERREAEERVAYLAYHDSLTGMPNRAMFDELLELSLARARRADRGVAVLALDIDNFKLINDSLGHETGDRLIVQIAARLQEATRDTDLVARPGGDEFLMLLADLDQMSPVLDEDGAAIAAQAVAHRVLDAFEAPFEVDGTELYVTASIGISVFPLDAADATSLLRNADSAVYLAKAGGPGTYVLNHLENDGEGLNLCWEVRDGIVNHTWSMPQPSTPEAQLVRFADRIAYVNHDVDDAVRAGVIEQDALPIRPLEVLGATHSARINTLVTDLVGRSVDGPEIGLSDDVFQALDALREFLFDHVYLRDEARSEQDKAISMVRSLFAHYLDHPEEVPQEYHRAPGDLPTRVADYIAGMTDRYALRIYEQLFLPQRWLL